MSIELKAGDIVRLRKDVMTTATTERDELAVTVTLDEGDIATISEARGEQVALVIYCVAESNSAGAVIAQGHILVAADDVELLQPVETDAPEPPPKEPPEEPAPKEPEMECNTRRYSTAMMKATTKRPEVFLYQAALKQIGAYDGDVDGWYGDASDKAVRKFQTDNNLSPIDGIIGSGTATELIKQAEAAGFEPDLSLRIMSVIAFYEVSNRADAFGMAEDDIGDSAGANYGVWQCNSLGSVNSILKLAGRNDLRSAYNGSNKTVVNPPVKDWFGSTEGIATQVRYYKEKLLPIAMRQLRGFGSFDAWESDPAMKTWWERAVLLFLDSVVQNGGMWSSKRPFWKDLVGSEGRPASQRVPELYHGVWWDECLGKYVKYEDFKEMWWAEFNKQKSQHSKEKDARRATSKAVVKEIVDNMIPADDPSAQLMVLAQVRSRTSGTKWWYQAVASRRVTDATGNSKHHPSGGVNGRALDLMCDYQL